MFNLEQSIAEWRKQMLAAGIQSPVPLEELENHLREEIEQRIALGISTPLAFEASIQQIGKTNVLKQEFEKIAGTKEAHESKKSQLALILSLGVFLLPFVVYFSFNSGLTPGQRLSGLAALVTTVLLTYIGQSGFGFAPPVFNRHVRLIIGLSGYLTYALWVVVFAYVVLPRLDFTASHLFMAICRAWTLPFGFLCGLILALEKAALKKAAMTGS